MRSRIPLSNMWSAVLFAAAFAAPGQTPAPAFNSVPAIAFDTSGPVIRAHTESEKPFTVAGEHGVVLGQQNGMFEAWVLPVKLLSHLTIEADIEGYTVPIDVNQQAARGRSPPRPDRDYIQPHRLHGPANHVFPQ